MSSITIVKAGSLLKKAALMNMLSSSNSLNITVCMEATGGVGKTSIVSQVAKEIGGEAFCIDCTTIGDGELNGFPFPSTDADGERIVEYSPFYVFAAIRRLEKHVYEIAKTTGFLNGKITLNENDDIVIKQIDKNDIIIKNTANKYLYTQNKYSWGRELPEELKFELLNSGEITPILVLFDEINRAAKAVLTETMNILLYHRVQSYILPWWVDVSVAINPPGANSEDYVQKINGAQKSRLLKLQIVPDIGCWTTNELKHGGDEALIEALNMQPTKVFDNHVQPVIDDMQTDGRAWSFVSRILSYIEKVNDFRYITDDERAQTETDLALLCEGKVGSIASTVLQARKNLGIIPKPVEILHGKEGINQEAIGKVKKCSAIKKYIFVENLLNYLSRHVSQMIKSQNSEIYLSQFAAIYEVLDDTNKNYLLKNLKTTKCEENHELTNKSILDAMTGGKTSTINTKSKKWQEYLFSITIATYQNITNI